MDGNITILLGAVLGAFAGGAANLWLDTRRRRNETMGLANAFYGEVVALLSKLKTREYIKHLREAAEANKPILIDAKQDYFTVYERNCEKLGMLPPGLTVEIAKFYIYAKAFIDDTDSYCSLNPHAFLSPKVQYKEMADLLEEIGRAGTKVIQQVQAMNRAHHINLEEYAEPVGK